MATTCFMSSTAIVFISHSADFSDDYKNSSVPKTDLDLLEFPLNLEYLEAEFFLYGGLGHGLDKVGLHLAEGGPSPIGAQKANLDTLTDDIILQFAYQEVGHLKLVHFSQNRLLGVESGQVAVIRGLLYEPATENVSPYQFVVVEFAT
ncbi:Translation elongation factor EF1B/ribosomal protein S6 family protein [Hibiscus syriacus]|uniref:Translation elongation factor EF1B/ribosomal protein S6 family protein n=1 Tax=Hibiscus syriacus TaxID=106335 RepID=A0A6A2WGX8_HIBSY|nr:Translation elongation factor EF1B/ribosomal protein S6 family protein [Hibiscus syriacus]